MGDGIDEPANKRRKLGILKPELVGILNPLNDDAYASTCPSVGDINSVPESPVALSLFQVVWARMTGYKPSWSPAIITASGSNNLYLVLFVLGEHFAESTSTEYPKPQASLHGEQPTGPLPKWYVEEHCDNPSDGSWLPSGVQYAWIPAADLKPWEGPHKENLVRTIAKLPDARKRKTYLQGVEHATRMNEQPGTIPEFVRRDSEYRQCVVKHTESVAADLAIVRPALKMAHLKLYIEANMMELHWRTIAYARQYVRAVPDEIFGGYHLIAAQDWPADEDVDRGVPEVILMYPGSILTGEEAALLETEERNGVHVDRNRYVAEIPNTAEILDKTGTVNVNITGKNLFVDGLKYSDPTSPLWAPGPTVNHERTRYCKLEPHHVSGNEQIRGFWLQRKRGEIITKGEPLFWSYDCGAGKFDADYGLDKLPPPLGWISSDDIRKHRQSK